MFRFLTTNKSSSAEKRYNKMIQLASVTWFIVDHLIPSLSQSCIHNWMSLWHISILSYQPFLLVGFSLKYVLFLTTFEPDLLISCLTFWWSIWLRLLWRSTYLIIYASSKETITLENYQQTNCARKHICLSNIWLSYTNLLKILAKPRQYIFFKNVAPVQRFFNCLFPFQPGSFCSSVLFTALFSQAKSINGHIPVFPQRKTNSECAKKETVWC